MPVWFTPASAADYDLLRSVIGEFHPDLVEAEAKIGLVLAHPDPDSGKPPLMKNKLQILAKIKPNSEADRFDGKPDATITLDAGHWKAMNEDGYRGEFQARVLIDHELYHLEVRREKDTRRIVTDDAGRPKFNTRPHDWEVTGFRAVAERHKQHAAEVIEARRFHDNFGNLLFHFANEHAVQRDLMATVSDKVVSALNAGELGPEASARRTGPHNVVIDFKSAPKIVEAVDRVLDDRQRQKHPAPAAVAAANR